jgi:hypothetical protein
MLNAGSLTFREFVMNEPLPLSAIQDAVLGFLRARTDAVIFGAQAVNAYVDEPRMSQDIDLLSSRAPELAEELRQFLAEKFHIAVRVREVAGGRGLRLYQVRKPENRYLIDIRPVSHLPSVEHISGIPVIAPAELIAYKVLAYHDRRGQPKSGTDWRDLAMLLLRFPELKQASGPVTEHLKALSSDPAVLAVWYELAAQEIQPSNEDPEF